jgi:hypothetical protein
MSPQRMIRQTLGLGLLMTLVVLALSACGALGGGGQPQAKVRPLPEYPQDLHAGTYHAKKFNPSVSFSVDKGWALQCPPGSDFVCLSRGGGEDTLFTFLNVHDVYKPSRSGTVETEPAPDDLIGWFEHHPYLQTDKPEPVTVGGVKGKQFDVVIKDLPDDFTGTCGSECLDLFALSDGDSWSIVEAQKNRFTVLEDVKGETVSVVFGSPAASFDEFVPEAEKVLESVEWKGS